MATKVSDTQWGPSHQRMDSPIRRKRSLLSPVAAIFAMLFLLGFLRNALQIGGGNVVSWTVRAVLILAAVRVILTVVVSWMSRTPRTLIRPAPLQRDKIAPKVVNTPPITLGARLRRRIQRAGGGTYLGVRKNGEWAVADPEHGVGIIGGPRSGKTTGFIVTGVASASGAVISTSTKPDVMEATAAVRSEVGQAWLFDPYGEEALPTGVRRLHWSPVAAAGTWDQALVIAGAMAAATRPGAGTTSEGHWKERAEALLAPLLYAANQSGRTIGDVSEWVLGRDLAPALAVLEDCDAAYAVFVLEGLNKTDARELSSIFSATAGVLAAYRSDAVRASAANPNFDPMRFARSTDTIYITSPEQYQALTAPLIVGLLEQVRHAVYHLAARGEMLTLMKWYVDEFTNMAPVPDPLGLISQAGGQRLQVILGFQDMSQIRARYSDAVADAFLTLLQTIVVLSGSRDSRILEAISLALGEYDRDVVSQSLGRSDPQEFMSSPTHSDNVSYQTQRQRILPPGDIARLPEGKALLLQGTDWELVELTKWHLTEPWRSLPRAEIPA
jgi:type IV secretion system protein VirD4